MINNLYYIKAVQLILYLRFIKLVDEIEIAEIQNPTPSTSNKKNAGKKDKGSSQQPAQRKSEGSRHSEEHNPEHWNFKINEANSHDRRFTRNKIRTTKYTWLTFLPKNLFE